MSAIGVQFVDRETLPPRSAPTDTGVWFVAGITERGPVGEPVLVSSMAGFIAAFGGRMAASPLYDAVETYFREGGGKAYISRVVGPGAVIATGDLADEESDPSLTIKAKSAGAWGNDLNVAVIAGDADEVVLVVSYQGDEVERSPSLADVEAAVAWSASSQWIVVEEDGDLLPEVDTDVDLTTGADDLASINEGGWATGIAAFPKTLGPGQVSIPGRSTTETHTALLTHASTHNRVAILDAPDSGVVATIANAASGLQGSDIGRFGAMFGPYAIVPGVIPGTTRRVPYSAVQAGLIARMDAVGSANVPAAGVNGVARYAREAAYTFTEAEYEELNAAGVNMARNVFGQVRTYGYRSLADPLGLWVQFSSSRLRMQIQAEAMDLAEAFVFAQIDGRGRKLAELAGALTGLLLRHYEQGALYGETPDEAFRVDVGSEVNTPESLQAGEVRAVMAVRMSPFGELVVIELVRAPITETL